MIDRRRLLGCLGALMALSARSFAQAPGRVYLLGILVESDSAAQRQELVVQALARLGYREGVNLRVERRNADGDAARIAAYATQLVALGVDVILCSGARVAMTLRDTTRTVPIVMAAASDPVGVGLVDSLPHPGRNLTGLADARLDAAAKRLQLLRETFPSVNRVAVWTQSDIPDAKPELATLNKAAQQLRLQLAILEANDLPGLERAARESRRWAAQAIYLANSPTATRYRKEAAALVADLRIPAIYPTHDNAVAGGLIAYAVSNADVADRAASYVDRIFKGAKPGDLPVEQPTKIQLTINMKTAKALGLTIPQSLLLRADEVIE